MTHKDTELLYGSTVMLIFYGTILLLAGNLVMCGITGMWSMFPHVALKLSAPLLFLVLVPALATLLLTAGAWLVGSCSGYWHKSPEEYWFTCIGWTLVLGNGGVVVYGLYTWIARPLWQWSQSVG